MMLLYVNANYESTHERGTDPVCEDKHGDKYGDGRLVCSRTWSLTGDDNGPQVLQPSWDPE